MQKLIFIILLLHICSAGVQFNYKWLPGLLWHDLRIILNIVCKILRVEFLQSDISSPLSLNYDRSNYDRVERKNESCPKIIKRSQWSTAPVKSVNYLIIPVPYVIIHHTVTPECNSKTECVARVESIRSFHMDVNGWHDIGYS
ncbi:unnamed protein product [Xylocopa violacea]|uniref:Peptidoglycan recognition protein family domain-containing protein n=1 Tax=Xylocopa violacea TaxID=135666 RepID=A0ABP1PAU4_XYLVO